MYRYSTSLITELFPLFFFPQSADDNPSKQGVYQWINYNQYVNQNKYH